MANLRLLRSVAMAVALGMLIACQPSAPLSQAQGGAPANPVSPSQAALRHVLAVPSNDERAQATVIPALPFSETIDTSEATAATGEESFCFPTHGGSVWYRFTPPVSTFIDVSSAGSSYPTGIIAFAGSSEFPFFGGCSSEQGPAELRFPAQAGETYFFRVSGSGEAPGGTLRFSVRALNVTLTVDPVAVVRPISRFQSEATITGTFRSDVAFTFFDGFMTLRQKLANKFIINQPFLFFSIGAYSEETLPLQADRPDAWSHTVLSENGIWSGGKAEVILTGNLCIQGQCLNGEILKTTIRLQKSP